MNAKKDAISFVNNYEGKFFLICADRVLVYDYESDSENDDGGKAIDSFRLSDSYGSVSNFCSVCIENGANFELA